MTIRRWASAPRRWSLIGSERGWGRFVRSLGLFHSKGAIDAQVCYAARHDNLNTIYWSANQRYFDLYDDGAEETPRRKLRVSLRKPEVLMQGAREQSEYANDFMSEISEIAY